MASGDSTHEPAWLERKDMLPTDADLLAADAAAFLDPGAADVGRDDVGRSAAGKIELARGKDIGLDLEAWRNQFDKVSTPGDLSLSTGAEGIVPISQHVGGNIDDVGRTNDETSIVVNAGLPIGRDIGRSIGMPGSLDGPKLEPGIAGPPGPVGFYRSRNLDGTVVDSHIPNEGEDGAGPAAPPRMAKVSKWTGVVVGLLVAVAVTVVTLAGAGSDLTLAPAGAIESPKKSEPPAGPVALSTPGQAITQGSTDPGGGPRTTPHAGVDASTAPGSDSASPKPTPKPDATEPLAKPEPDETGRTGRTQPTAPPATAPQGGKHKISPRDVTASCGMSLAPFEVIVDNTSGSVDIDWSLAFDTTVMGGPWGTASHTVGLLHPGEFKVITITPSDLCKVVTAKTTFLLIFTINGATEEVPYIVNP